jgi:nucleotide-binding universal stress UspA family protein
MRLIIAFDDTAYGRDALELGLRLAATSGETPTVATVYPDDDATVDATEARQNAERKLGAARAVVGGRANVRFEAVGPTYASLGLHEYAEQTGADLLVVGSSEHAPMGAVTPDSTVERLLNGAPCPVAVAPRGYRKRSAAIRDIAVAYDGSPESQQALGVAVRIAQRINASLRLVAVAREPDEALRAALDVASREFPPSLKVTTEVVIGPDVAVTLAGLPQPSPGLLVCGSRGVGPRRRVLLRSASTRVIRSAAYPVIVVPHTLDQGDGDRGRPDA